MKSNVAESKNVFLKKSELLELAPPAPEVSEAKCKCCGLREECTEAYITQIKRSHSGKWVCGLCSEAVKETIKRSPETALREAVRSQREFCQKYNTTIRLNPKLSFTCDMRDFVKKSSENRVSPKGLKLGRSTSCVPSIDFQQYKAF